MWLALRRLALGIFLIAGASAILLLSDVKWEGEVPRIAIFQFSSRPTLDESVAGMLEGLASEGFVEGRNISIQRFNAENDLPTANTIAKGIVSGKFKLVLTSSTPCLQTMAGANQDGGVIHVFAAVTDPCGAGVGISRENPLDHPKHLVGIGTFQPVERVFDLARELFPGLKKVGVAWNPAEACSEACVRKARAKCKELGIELVEAQAENSTGVYEAAQSLVARGAEALWIGGDNTVELAIDSLVTAARNGHIPVFDNNPDTSSRGVLLALGANHRDVGALAGRLAGRILKGLDPATVRVENVVPEKLVFNTTALAGLKDPWRIPPDLMAKADAVYAPDGVHEKSAAQERRPLPGRTYKVGLVYFSPDPGSDLVIGAIFDGLRDKGFIVGRNLEVRQMHAQGEIANITIILQNFDASDVDLIVTMTTPCLTAACSAVRTKPVVFTYVYDPIAAGAAKSRTEHVPHVTGVGSFPPIADTLAAIRQLVPGVKAVGTVYNSSEANSRKVMEVARGLFKEQGIRLEEIAITASNEVHQAALTLSQKGIDAFWVAGDNTALVAFDAIASVAQKARLPLVINDTEFVDKGALAACGIGFYKSGYESGVLAARVLLGEKPADIPIEEIAVKQVGVNFEAARALGVTFPENFLKGAELFYNLRAKLGRPARVALVQVVDNPVMNKACEGVLKALEEAKIKQGADFTLRRYNAQGDISQLSLIMSAIKSQRADLVITAGTPTMLAAAQAIHDIPIVFTVASDPKVLGVFQGNQRPANLVGVHDDPPVDQLLKLAQQREPPFDTVGTVWDPSQPNSEISVKKLRRACEEAKVKLVESTAAAVPDLPQATESLCARGAKVIIVSADNLVTTGFPAIAQAAKKRGVPVYATEVGLVKAGAAAVMGDDYLEWGQQSGRLAAKVLASVKPASLPIEKTAVQRTVFAKPPKPSARASFTPAKTWKLFVVRYSDSPISEDATRGLHEGLAATLVEGRDYTLQEKSAQGDIVTLNTIFDAIKSEGADLVITFSTPTLQAAVHKFDKSPVVFSVVADGVVAGAGRSETDHRPNVTGITTLAPFDQMPKLLKECMPSVRRVGTLFTPSEDNSVHNKNTLARCLKEAGIELVEAPANTSSEVSDAAMSLCSRRIDAVSQISDNLTCSSFTSISKAAEREKLPLFGFISEQAKQGAVLVIARDYIDAGREAATVALRVMRGENPAAIPFSNLKTARLIVNLPQARKLGLNVPDSVIQRADEVIR